MDVVYGLIENGSVVNGATKDKIRALIATSGDDVLLAAPFDNQYLTWKTAVLGPSVDPVQPTLGGFPLEPVFSEHAAEVRDTSR
jgi:hypothetical protein